MTEQSRTEKARELIEEAASIYTRTKLAPDDATFTQDLVNAVRLLADEIDELKKRSLHVP